jgi:hypothetical protein
MLKPNLTPGPAIMIPVMINKIPNIFGHNHGLSWKSRALESKTSTKARLIKGQA